ncbi:TPA: hypothetical protein P0E34_001253 [Vibrio campbellii]|nr:hypothetical protein [Vibrio campbellii]
MRRLTFRNIAIGLLLMIQSMAHASTLNDVDIQEQDVGNQPYYVISAMFTGEVEEPSQTSSPFSVPVSLMIPKQSCNQVAIVDVVNSVLFEFPPTPLGYITLNIGQIILGENFISGRGENSFIYASVIWDKNVVDQTSGTIVKGTDGYSILRQFAHFLKTNEVIPMLQLETDCDIKQTIGFGWSQTGKLLATMLTEELNGSIENPAFDGLFLGVAGGICRHLINDVFPWRYTSCAKAPNKHVPTVAYNTQSETELARGDGKLRNSTSSLSVYEYAGLAHIDKQFLPFEVLFGGLGFNFKQNPISVAPSVRAAFWNLYLKVKDDVPTPKSRTLFSKPDPQTFVSFLDLRGDDSLLSWSGGQVYITDSNRDGFAEGGIRLPHMPSSKQSPFSSKMGAPLGIYGGIDYSYAGGPGIFFANGGTFSEYDDETLLMLYPTKQTYVQRVVLSVWSLIFERYLLIEDGMMLIEQAEELQLSIWEP